MSGGTMLLEGKTKFDQATQERSFMIHPGKALCISLMAVGISAINPLFDHANAAADGERHRYQECRQLRASGQLKWYSIASGIVDDGGGRNGYGGFTTKACHASEHSCRRWVQNIAHEIRNLDSLDTAYCKRVN
jgi:hypothetical protein